MLLPCALLDAVLLGRVSRLFVAPLPVLAALLPVVPVLPLLLGALLLIVPVLLLLLGSLLLLIVLVLPLPLLGLLLVLPLLLSMLRLRLGFLLALLLFGVAFLLILLVLLCIGKSSSPEKQRQYRCTDDFSCFHRCYSPYGTG
jgi:hypothetical protein